MAKNNTRLSLFGDLNKEITKKNSRKVVGEHYIRLNLKAPKWKVIYG